MKLFETEERAPVHYIDQINGVEVYLLREDLIHPEISGNKFRKLKYNFRKAIEEGEQQVLTFGGAFSNHIAATAAAAEAYKLASIGIIRGEELGKDASTIAANPTLVYASQKGMRLSFIDRAQYREKTTESYLHRLRKEFGSFYLIPEGGSNALAVKGVEELLNEEHRKFDYICCSVGTGGTLSGLINGSFPDQKLIGFAALKGNFLKTEVEQYTSRSNWKISTDYHFGGYAKMDEHLINFINNFKIKYEIQLDPVYTGKMMYGIFDLIRKHHFPRNTCILALHSGGLQGIPGMNLKLEKKRLPRLI